MATYIAFMDSFHGNGTREVGVRCEVELSGENITITYRTGASEESYSGRKVDNEFFQLTLDEDAGRNGKASLFVFPNERECEFNYPLNNVFRGSYSDKGHGFWEIRIQSEKLHS